MTLRIKSTKRVAGLFAVSFCLALPGLSYAKMPGEPVGSVEAKIGDATYKGKTFDAPGQDASSTSFQAAGPLTTVTIQAHDSDAPSMMENVFGIQITLNEKKASAPVFDASLSYWPGGMKKPFYVTENSGVQTKITFDEMTFDGGTANMKGSFSGKLCKKKNFMSETDTSDCLPVEGTFDTALRSGN